MSQATSCAGIRHQFFVWLFWDRPGDGKKCWMLSLFWNMLKWKPSFRIVCFFGGKAVCALRCYRIVCLNFVLVPNCLQLINKYWRKKRLPFKGRNGRCVLWISCGMQYRSALSVTIRYCRPLTLKDGWNKRETSINRWKYDRPLRTLLNNDLIWLLRVSHNTCMFAC